MGKKVRDAFSADARISIVAVERRGRQDRYRQRLKAGERYRDGKREQMFSDELIAEHIDVYELDQGRLDRLTKLLAEIKAKEAEIEVERRALVPLTRDRHRELAIAAQADQRRRDERLAAEEVLRPAEDPT